MKLSCSWVLLAVGAEAANTFFAEPTDAVSPSAPSALAIPSETASPNLDPRHSPFAVQPYGYSPGASDDGNLFGHPCFMGDMVSAGRDLKYGAFTVLEGTRGKIADNLGAHGAAPLNVLWDGTNPGVPLQAIYKDLSDESCVRRRYGSGQGGCAFMSAGDTVGEKTCAGKIKKVCSAGKGMCGMGQGGACKNQDGGTVVDGKKCSGKMESVCNEGEGNCKKAGRWSRGASFDDSQYPVIQ